MSGLRVVPAYPSSEEANFASQRRCEANIAFPGPERRSPPTQCVTLHGLPPRRTTTRNLVEWMKQCGFSAKHAHALIAQVRMVGRAGLPQRTRWRLVRRLTAKAWDRVDDAGGG